ncbi:NACHT domain-containing protein [Streptomyces sp. MBT65]|uniref:NACHT domain-containing protein n=1 Tax=Streptomyces sp. MBT65 TaxID=1488395 RepID=UPI00190969EA|nr:NACHT domain-containing protein [Streptomyces sp. MBT65]MBK3576436.1 NACHT domain-containing protein [Streptomyces sp. MBT65]
MADQRSIHRRVPVGVQYLLWSALGAFGALILAWYYELDTASTAAAFSPSLGASYLAWKSFEQDRPSAKTASEVVDDLAKVMEKQADTEMQIRRVYDQRPLCITWRAVRDGLVERWSSIVYLACSRPGFTEDDARDWPMDAAGLEDADGQIGEVFIRKLPTQRLVVLGGAGAGKTVLLIRLLQHLIKKRSTGGPVPILFTLATWVPKGDQLTLESWLVDQLRFSYPALRTAASRNATLGIDVAPVGRGDLAQALWNEGYIIPIFDGFDEMPPRLHRLALAEINRTLPSTRALVLASRTDAYRDAVVGNGDTPRGNPLRGAAGIELLPVPSSEALEYLDPDWENSVTPGYGSWDSVIATAGTGTPVGQALSTPLGLFLARTVYNFSPSGRSNGVSILRELLDLQSTSRGAVNMYLLQGFLPAAYSRLQPNPPQWSLAQAQRTLIVLAKYLKTCESGRPDLMWWRLRGVLPDRSSSPIWRLLFAAIFGVSNGIALTVTLAASLSLQLISIIGVDEGLENGASLALKVGVLFGFLAGFTTGVLGMVSAMLMGRGIPGSDAPSVPGVRMRWSPHWMMKYFTVAWLAIVIVLYFTLRVALPPFFMLLLMFTLVLGRTIEVPDLIAIGPNQLYKMNRRLSLRVGLQVGFTYGGISGAAAGILYGHLLGLQYGIVAGLTFGMGTVIVVSFLAVQVAGYAPTGTRRGSRPAWIDFFLTRAYLAIRWKVPWNMMRFLEDAHKNRGVLRQVGASYQFRHVDLQHYLADLSLD